MLNFIKKIKLIALITVLTMCGALSAQTEEAVLATKETPELPINRFLKIELSEDDYEILNLEDGVQYAIRTETDENGVFVIRVYDENNHPFAQYPGNATVYPLFDDEAELGPNTIIVSQETNDEDLINLEDDLIIFRRTEITQTYEVGNILFGGTSHESPYGYLRKLISKEEREDGSIFFETELASLIEAFDKLSIHRLYDFETLIDEETGEGRFKLVGVNGVSTRGTTTLGELSFGINAEIITGLELDFTFKGKLQLEFVVNIQTCWAFVVPYPCLDEFKLVGHFNLDATISSSISAKFKLSKQLGTGISLGCIPIYILGVPLDLCNTIVFKLEASSEMGTKFEGGVNGKITAKAGVHYTNSRLNGVSSFDSHFSVYPPTFVSYSDKIGLYIVPELQVKPYNLNILTGYLNFKIGPTVTLRASPPPPQTQWEVSLGANINTGIRLSLKEFIGIDIGIESEFSTPTWKLISWGGNITPEKPSVTTLAASGISTTFATLKGNVTSAGLSPTITKRGFLWGLYSEKLDNSEPIDPPHGLGIFEKQITGLESDKTYYYRAYAQNGYSPELAYGEIRSFKSSLPVLYPDICPPYNITTNSVMVDAGFSRSFNANTIIPDEYGFVWTTNSFPDVSEFDAYPNKMSVPINVEKDSYSAIITGLSLNTQYGIKSYIKYAGKTAFSTPVTIKTFADENSYLTVIISDPTDITITSAKFNVSVTGIPPVTEKGICYSLQNPPTTEDFVISYGGGAGSFTATLNNLQEAQLYYVRPYAITNGETHYYQLKEFTASSVTINISNYTNLTTVGATFKVEVASALPITEKGICYSLQNPPTTANSKISYGSGNGEFTAILNNLQEGTPYYVRPYAIANGETHYGENNVREFVTLYVTRTISDPIDITETSATFNVTIGGNAPIAEKGICYSASNPLPTIADSRETAGAGLGSFTATLTGLQDATVYYARPYAISSGIPYYGDVKSFSTACNCNPIDYNISYIDKNGTLLCTCVQRITTGGSQILSTGWYSLSNEQLFSFTGTITIAGAAGAAGAVHLILEDGCDWRINGGGVRVNAGRELHIYAQSTGESMGKLTATGTSNSAGIGGGDDTDCGDIIINGGVITATGSHGTGRSGGGAGIGGGGSYHGACSSCGKGGSGGNITINGGTIIANGCDANDGYGRCLISGYNHGGGGGGAGIGGGGGSGGQSMETACDNGYKGGSGGTITINGGNVTATGGKRGNGGNESNCLLTGRVGGGGGGGKGADIGGGGGGGGGSSMLSLAGGILNGSGSNGGNDATIGNGSKGGNSGTFLALIGDNGDGGSGGDGGEINTDGGTVNGVQY